MAAAWGQAMSVATTAPDPGDADLQAVFAATLVDEWVRCGVDRAVVCPGSRSTPLVVELAAHPGMTVHVRLDERAAGFTALGMGLATGRPALVVTTSGTAAAELHASVVEADLSGVPLIACTADRPPELQDVGAPQTIDQARLFGTSPRWFADPGVPDVRARSSWRSLAARAVGEATAGARGPGPVHLNLPFREPLLGDRSAAPTLSPGRSDGEPWHRVVPGASGPSEEAVAGLASAGALVPGSRGLIVAGAGCGEPVEVLALGAALGWPILADPRSGLRGLGPAVVAAADGILRSERFAADHRPECVLRLGGQWVSKVVNGFLATSVAGGARSISVDPWGRWVDPDRECGIFVRSDPSEFCRRVGRSLATGALPAPTQNRMADWTERWRRAEAAAQDALDRVLGAATATMDGADDLSEPALARRLVAHLPADATLVVSSSMPVRDVEAFAAPPATGPRIVANRGANGIDGVVSTALGVALASGGPTVVLVGDLAFLHDVSALVTATGFSTALTVVVADNAGGGIFNFLPPATVLDPGTFETLFATPQATGVESVASGFGWPVEVTGPELPLESALDRALARRGLGVIRVPLPARAENVAVHARVNAEVVGAVDAGRRGPADGVH
jgi:2-succinyl-5-enolpyruvyl-6-hydroxy-3-cyclohexene-1-carboxylate synthase